MSLPSRAAELRPVLRLHCHYSDGESEGKNDKAADHGSILMHNSGVNITQDYRLHVIYHAHLMSLLSLIPAVLLLLAQAPTPEQKAVGYVLDAVPRWPTENHCFSCHNNGDGARALFVAYRMKYSVSAAALKSTTEWLQKPNEWGKSGTLGFGDEKLATIQFGAALVDAVDAGIVVDKSLMARAAAQLLPHQEADGSWQVDAQASAPSAVTYGPVLATFMARRTLERAGDNQLADAIARSDGWLRAADIASAVNAAAVVLAFENRMDVASRARARCGPERSSQHAEQRWRLGGLRQNSLRTVRIGDGAVGNEYRSRARGNRSPHREGPRVSDFRSIRGWRMAGSEAVHDGRDVRPTHFDHRVGDAGVARHEALTRESNRW